MTTIYARKKELVGATFYEKGDPLPPGVEKVAHDGEQFSIVTRAGRVGIRDGDVIVRPDFSEFPTLMTREAFEARYQPAETPETEHLRNRILAYSEAFGIAYAQLAPDVEVNADDPVAGMREIIASVHKQIEEGLAAIRVAMPRGEAEVEIALPPDPGRFPGALLVEHPPEPEPNRASVQLTDLRDPIIDEP